MYRKHSGLTTAEAHAALQTHGQNAIASSNTFSALRVLLKQFQSPLIFILFFASAISFSFADYKDAAIIAVVLIVNAVIGFVQEYKAEKALLVLIQSISDTTKVVRNGSLEEINTTAVVPKDLVVIESGRRVPSDGILLDANELQIDESVLTGESEPVLKKKDSLVYKGTLVVGGTGIFETQKTGEHTEFGKIAYSLQKNHKADSPIQQEIRKISKVILIVVCVFVALLLLMGQLNGMTLFETYKIAVALSVSVIPEGLLIAFTVTLAVAMHAIMRKGAVVKSLPAAEALGSIDVLCVDKTGTLTQGKMKVAEVESVDMVKMHQALAACNNENNYVDQAIKDYLLETEKKNFFVEKKQLVTEFFPFSSQNKYSAAVVDNELYVVGAPEFIITNGIKNISQEVKQRITDTASEGFRVLAVGFRPLTDAEMKLGSVSRKNIREFSFLGLLLLRDPVKHNVGLHIAQLQEAGIEIKVLTGDVGETTRAVLNEIGVAVGEKACLSGKELAELQKKDAQSIAERIASCTVFYRVTPDQKLWIVQRLQDAGMKVGMMGDGVNDAPALKRAQVGIGVDTATDVSKEVADIVLLEKDLKILVYAVGQARHAFANLKKSMTFLLSTSYANASIVLLALLTGLPLPITPVQVLWVNLVEDGFAGLAFGFEKYPLAKKHIYPKSTSIFDYRVVFVLSIMSIVMAGLYFGLYAYLLEYSAYSAKHLQTLTLASVSVSSLLFMFSVKTIDATILIKTVFDNAYINASFLVGVLLLAFAMYVPFMNTILDTVPLGLNEWGLIVVLGFLQLLVVEMIKYNAHALRFF